MSISFKVETNKITAARSKLSGSDRVVEQLARMVESEAKQRAAVKTGAMRASITVEKPDENVRKIGPTVDYGVVIEFGKHGSHAQPFMRPALDRVRAESRQIWKEFIDGL